MNTDTAFRRPGGNPAALAPLASPTFTGTVTAPRLSYNAPGGLVVTPWMTIDSTFPGLTLSDTNGATHQKLTQIYANDSVAFAINTMTDASGFGEEVLRIERSGTAGGTTRIGGTALAVGDGGWVSGVGGVRLRVSGTGFSGSSMSLARYENGTDGPYLVIAKTRGGTVGNNAAVQSGDALGRIQFRGGDGATTQVGLQISAVAAAAPSGGVLPTVLVLESGGVVRMRIGDEGSMSLGGTIGAESLRVVAVPSAVNRVHAVGAASGAAPILSADGGDANIDLALVAKGTGRVRFGAFTAGALTPAGFIEIRDAGGTIRRLMVG